MFRRHSRAQKPTAASPDTPVVAHSNQETSFHAGDRVKTLTELGGWPAGSTGAVQYLNDDGHPNVRLDNGFFYDATAKNLERLPPEDPHVFQVGNRVRLAEEFVGVIWGPGFAGEFDGPDGKGEPVSHPAGSTGTIIMTGSAEGYAVALDDGMKLAVRGTGLERIPGRAHVFTDPDSDIIRIRPVFRYLDSVRLRVDFIGDKGTYAAGWTGQIRPLGIHVAERPAMEECWRTGEYTVWLDHERGIINVPGDELQLASDTL